MASCYDLRAQAATNDMEVVSDRIYSYYYYINITLLIQKNSNNSEFKVNIDGEPEERRGSNHTAAQASSGSPEFTRKPFAIIEPCLPRPIDMIYGPS